MRLTILHELKYGKAFSKVRPHLKKMPTHKRKHSKRVGRELHKAGLGHKSVYSGILHDFIERGGSIDKLHQLVGNLGLPAEVTTIVKSLSSDEKQDTKSNDNEPLEHIRSVLNTIKDEDIRNIIILVKIADRVDNLRKRLRKKGKIGRRYRQKSRDLMSFLSNNYTGKKKYFNNLMQSYQTVMAESINYNPSMELILDI